MNNRRAIPGVSVLLATLLLASGLMAATPARNETPSAIRWAVRTDAPDPATVAPLACTRVGYQVDVYGGTAIGTLTYALSHAGTDAVTVRFEATVPATLEVLGLFAESEGRVDELAIEAAATPPAAPSRPQVRRAPNGPPAEVPATSSVRSGPLEIPGESTVEVRTRFRLPLSIERGVFGLTLPGVEQQPSDGAQAPHAARIVLSGVSVIVHHDAPLLAAASSTHEILVDFLGDRTIIEPVAREFPANQAFALTFATSPEREPTLAGRVLRNGESGHTIEVVLDPPREPEKKSSRAKQVVFVVDTSGSMSMLEKMEQAKRAVERSLESLQPADRFNVIEFDDDFHLLRPVPVEPPAPGDDSVKRWLQALTADGGTVLLPALTAALDQPEDPERHGIVVVVTDGILSDEKAALDLLKERLGERRLFVVGAGSMVRQETLLRLAEYGRGNVAFFGESGTLEQAVTDLFASISDPLAWDLRLDWEGGEVTEIEPARLPDLYAFRPVRILARVRGDLPSSFVATVSTVDGERRFRVSLPPVQ